MIDTKTKYAVWNTAEICRRCSTRAFWKREDCSKETCPLTVEMERLRRSGINDKSQR